MFLLQQAEVAENMKGDFVGIELVFMYRIQPIIKPVANGPSARQELRREIGFYMQTKRSWKKVTFGSLF
jgi:hypothetical protein